LKPLPTNEVDNECYLAAFREVAGRELTDDFHVYPQVTDEGIFHTGWERMFGRGPDPKEVARMKAAFLVRLEAARAAEPDRFGPVPGAGGLLAGLRDQADLALGLATGCWRGSAERKLEWAGLEAKGLPLATSDDVPSRAGIIRTCLDRAAGERGVSGFEAAVYYRFRNQSHMMALIAYGRQKRGFAGLRALSSSARPRGRASQVALQLQLGIGGRRALGPGRGPGAGPGLHRDRGEDQGQGPGGSLGRGGLAGREVLPGAPGGGLPP